MKYQKQLKLALAFAIPFSISLGYILELRKRLQIEEWGSRYYEEKFNSALHKLPPDKVQEILAEIATDKEFMDIANSTLEDTL